MCKNDGIDGLFTSASRAGQLPDGNVLAYAPVQRAAMRHLQEWMVAGTPPPSQPRLEIDPGPPAALVRDEWGNALGGIRVPDLAVPIAAHHGLREGDPHASLAGRSTPFSEAQLRERYPSRQAFLDAYAGAIDDAVAAGVLLPDDTDTLRTRAWHVADAFITW